jgi:short-subunit dehydrogenase
MKYQASGRVVVITGASSGIGRATALRFAENGDTVVLAARRKSLLNDVVDDCEESGSEALAVECDVSQESAIEKLTKSTIKKFGRIDVWINDAGVGAVGNFEDLKPKEHHRVIETNLNGVINGSWYALRQFKEQGRGVLINISSVLGKITQPYMASYAASKHAVRALSACIRQELWLQGAEDIHVCTVFPQSVDTPFFENEANRSGYKATPAPPIETPENVAEIIFQLAENPRDEAHVGKMGKVMSMQQKVARNLTEKQMSWMASRSNFDRSKKEKPHSGSLWKANKGANGDIRGGWKKDSGFVRPLTLATAAPIGLAVWLMLRKNKSSQLRAAA